ncbi:MAG: methionine--tRNA ligase [Candidatus Geothermarchaeales archaeon]
MTQTVSYGEFDKLDIRIGRVVEARRVEGTEKLLRLVVDLGVETRQVVWAAGNQFGPESSLPELTGKTVVLLSNLEPKQIRGVRSEGMILEAQHIDDPDRYTMLTVSEEVPIGSRIR